MKVYAGVDPLSGKRLYLTETVPAGLRALAEAKKVRTRLIGQIDEQRNPRTRATVNQLMDRYLDVVDVGVTTRARYEGVIRLHVRPLLGELPVSGSRARQSTPSTGLRSTRSTPRNRRAE
jgi:integrase